MPYLTDWLEMPSASSQPGPSLFDPPALRSMGTKRGRLNESIQAAQTQKMAAYQAQMRKMEMQKLADDEARAVLPVLQSLDINSPDYHDRVGSLLTQFPLSAESPAVSNILQVHDRTLNGIRQQQESERRENEEDQKMLAEDPALQYLFSQKAKIEGPEAARAAIRAKRFNDAQALRLIELGEDPENPKFKLDDQYFDKKQIDMLEAKKKGGDKGIPQGAAEAYHKAIGLASSGIPEDEKAGKFMLNFLDARHPELKNFNASPLPASTTPDNVKPVASGARKAPSGNTVRKVE